MTTNLIVSKQGSRELGITLVDTDLQTEDIVRDLIIRNNGLILDELGGPHLSRFDTPNLTIKAQFPSTESRDETKGFLDSLKHSLR